MAYDKTHTDAMCDKCGKEVGIPDLWPFPYLYKDLNDHVHLDADLARKGYKQYFGCKKCIDKERIAAIICSVKQKTGEPLGWMGFPLSYLEENGFYDYKEL